MANLPTILDLKRSTDKKPTINRDSTTCIYKSIKLVMLGFIYITDTNEEEKKKVCKKWQSKSSDQILKNSNAKVV